jgi:diguanylate cyclase (GGDEF)-like protein
MNLDKKSISKAILVLPIVGVVITSLIISLISVFSIEQAFEKQKQEITERFMQNLKATTKEKVNLAYVIIDALYKKNLKIYKNKELAKKATFKDFPSFFDKFRWPKKGYIFMFSIKDKGVTVYHINHKFMKINRWNLVRHGQKIMQIITNAAIAHPNGTYVRYIAYNPDGKPQDKISYVKVYKPLDILIGAGVYLNYLDKDLLKLQKQTNDLLNNLLKKIVLISLISIILITIIVYFLSKEVQKLFIKYENEIQKEKEKFKKRAYFDYLTGLYTRYGATKEFEKIKKNLDNGNKKTAILFIDLDYFKEINDSLGHNVGDKILRIIANRLRKCVTIKDKVIRFGGDEFIIILNEMKDIREVEELIENILAIIRAPINLNNMKFYVSASIGAVIYPDDSDDFETLIKFADSAMYEAKRMGKDRYMFFKKEISEAADEKLHLKNEIRRALEKGEFEIYFQPQVDRFGKTYGAEVLIRWNHPKKGIISPLYFIPLVIEIGIIDKIDLWVIEEAIKQHIKWQKKGYFPILSCNVTIYQLEKGKFAKDLKALFEKYNFNPKYLNIEVTEEGVMKNPELSIKILNEINNLGVKINIDDFGTGYSSLVYLKKLPVSKLKIDREFIKDLSKDKDDRVIIKTTINMAKNLNLESVAEGVETKEQLEFLLSNDCDYIQGYFYSPPIPAEEFEEKFLKDKNDN